MKFNPSGNTDETEKSRKLSQAEQKRLERFEAVSDEMIQNGFRRTDLTVSLVKANLIGILFAIPVFVLGFALYILRNGFDGIRFDPGLYLPFLIVMVLLIVVHELIHGFSWAIFAEHHLKDIAFGFIVQYLTPYCACCVPLKKGQYVFGAVMPLVLLGLIPSAAGILAGSMPVLLMGMVMIVTAVGDLMIIWMVLRYRSDAAEIVYMDHPTQAGGVIFER